MAYESSQGISFVFSGDEFALTSISVSKGAAEVDTSDLKLAYGSERKYRISPLRDGAELQVEFFGMKLPQQTATGAITWSVDGSGSNAAFTTGLPTVALCTSASVQAAAGELIRGSATFRLTAG
jgi:hypothetical protein